MPPAGQTQTQQMVPGRVVDGDDLSLEQLRGLISGKMTAAKTEYQAAKGLQVRLKGLVIRLAGNSLPVMSPFEEDPAIGGPYKVAMKYTRAQLKQMLDYYEVNYLVNEKKPKLVDKVEKQLRRHHDKRIFSQRRDAQRDPPKRKTGD